MASECIEYCPSRDVGSYTTYQGKTAVVVVVVCASVENASAIPLKTFIKNRHVVN